MGKSRGVYMLSAAHRDAIPPLLADARIAAALGLPQSHDDAAARDWVAAQVAARAQGQAYLFVLSDRGHVLGICGLREVGRAAPAQFVVAVRSEQRGKGHAHFAGERVLEFAFQNLQLGRVAARAPAAGGACSHVLERLGFRERSLAQPGPATRQAEWELTREQWLDARARSALAVLHPSLRAILEAELTAGNEVAETSSGWPDPDSVFVRLRHAFRSRPAQLPEDVEYAELNDPHWWKAEYRASKPRHTLAS